MTSLVPALAGRSRRSSSRSLTPAGAGAGPSYKLGMDVWLVVSVNGGQRTQAGAPHHLARVVDRDTRRQL